ncbi:MAG TPA: thioesterase family protein, partial [Acidimicrobiales bacterium]|nr:thioesterase family protein [Acidimicrobiales bacterium]
MTPEREGTSPDATPVSYRARAWHDGAVVADTTGAVRVDQADGPPALWFPAADVQLDALPDGAVWADAPGAAKDDVAGRVALDHDVVRVELVDELDVKRFPTWGDAADLVDVLDLRPDGGRAWVSVARADWRRPVVEASQMLGQCVVAAMRHARGRRVVSSHLVVPRIADARQPVRIALDEVSAGRTFTTLAATVHQGDRVVATGAFLLDATAPDVVRHAEPAPDVPGPLECPAYDMAVTGRDLRIVNDAYTGDPDAPAGPPVLDTWLRFREGPDDPAIHAGLLA